MPLTWPCLRAVLVHPWVLAAQYARNRAMFVTPLARRRGVKKPKDDGGMVSVGMVTVDL